MELYNKVVQFVDESFGGKKPHFERTVYWIQVLFPNVTEACRIAAYAHDIERAFRDKNKFIPENYLDVDFLRNHQNRGAKIIGDFLEKSGAELDLIDKVKGLIGKHETGGGFEENALMDADSISFFETNAEMFVIDKAPVEGYTKVKEKFDWMFNRISSDERRKFASENYKKWLKAIEVYKNK